MRKHDPVIVTGVAGFIGHATAHRLLDDGEQVIGVDDLNSYYDPALKHARLSLLAQKSSFEFKQLDIAEHEAFSSLVRMAGVRRIIHLAAQAGVRYSIDKPFTYERANLAGHLSVLEACRNAANFEHLVYASSSSVYGDMPASQAAFHEDDPAIEPVSLYAATKRSGELMSAAYARLYGFAQTGLRFFTVYGPWGRPDMAYFDFTRKILANESINVFGYGKVTRDFTYIDDIVDGITGVLKKPPESHKHRILNIGNSTPISVMELISTLEGLLGKKATLKYLPMQPGDVTSTYADISRINALTGYDPQTDLHEGLDRFVSWYKEFYYEAK